MRYDADNQVCHDEDANVVASWAGGGGGQGNEQRAFQFTHSEWEVRQTFWIVEEGIDRRVEMVGRIPVKIDTVYAPGAQVTLQPFREPEILAGNITQSPLTADQMRSLIQCLYSEGGKHPVKVVL